MWQCINQSVKHVCSEHQELNYFTTEQLVVLRRELGTFLSEKTESSLNQVCTRQYLANVNVRLLLAIPKFSDIPPLFDPKYTYHLKQLITKVHFAFFF